MKYILSVLFIWFIFSLQTYSQKTHTVMTYNLLNYPVTDTTIRNPYFRTVFSNVQPDILVVQEMMSLGGVNGFLTKVLNQASDGYAAGLFLDGPDSDNAIFYKSSQFTFISNTPISTDLRNINQFRLRENLTGDTITIFSLHLKANNTPEDSLQRADEVDVLRNITNSLPANSEFIVVGDFNIYDSGELAFQKLLDQALTGYFIDPLNLVGHWNNNGSFAPYHTQSTRTRVFGDGSAGGLDDRFDMILMSQGIINNGSVSYIPGSYTTYGNDGSHFNDSINQPPNYAVGQEIANALHYASDHLPVFAEFNFDAPFLQLTSFKAIIEGLYNGSQMISDTVTVELHETSSPYALIDTSPVLLNNSGEGTGKFFNAENGIPYYVVIRYRNAIETWSAQPQTFSSNTLSYDFTSAQNKAYGNNLKLINGKWCIYSGDVNQDGLIDINDLNMVFTDNVNGLYGRNATDITGDLFTEIQVSEYSFH